MRNLIFSIILLCTISNFSQVKHGDGIYREYYKTGQLKTEGYYKNNKKFSVWKEYYASGTIKRIYTFKNNGDLTGIEETYAKSGNLVSERKPSENGGFIYRHFYDNGNLQAAYDSKPSKENRRFFVKEGGFKQYYENGVLKTESTYSQNLLNGVWTQYYDTGEKEWEVQYLEGHKQGPYKQFYKSGQIKLQGTCNNELKNGDEKQYDSIGNLANTFSYKKGKLKKGKLKGIVETEIPDGDIEKVPVYPGCGELLGNQEIKHCMSDKISRFVADTFNTNIATDLGLTGRQRILVIFKIDKTGQVIDVKSRAPFKELEAEAVRVIGALPKMKPGMQFGKVVTVPYALPIVFMVGEKRPQKPKFGSNITQF